MNAVEIEEAIFGVQSVDQIHAEVIATATPWVSKTGAIIDKSAEKVTKAGGMYALAGLAPTIFNAAFRRQLKPDRILVFDDLERSAVKIKDLLGAINFYVEQQGFRVIVIAHDKKIADDFLAMKEKTFGQTIRVEPLIDEALSFFFDEIKNPIARKFLSTYRSEILDIFKSSGVPSLRVLRHIVEDVERLVRCLEPNRKLS